jgi:hypothetical protein
LTTSAPRWFVDMQNEFFEEATGTYYERIAKAMEQQNVDSNTLR